MLGYGGWNDVVFDTVAARLAAGARGAPEVVWAFFDSEAILQDATSAAGEACRRVLARFKEPLAACHASFYSGVDAHRHLPEAFPREGSPPSSRPGAAQGTTSRADFDARVRGLLEELLPHVAESERSRIERLLKAAALPDFTRVIAALCKTLDALRDPDARRDFARRARKVVVEASSFATQGLPPVNLDADAPLRVEVRTSTFAEILMARAEERDPDLEPHPRGPRGKSALEVDRLLEAGPAAEDWTTAFEAELWRRLGFAEDIGPYLADPRRADREHLYGALRARGDLSRRLYVLLRPDKLELWNDIASGLAEQAQKLARSGAITAGPVVTFLVRSDGEKQVLPFAESQLTSLIGEFLALTER